MKIRSSFRVLRSTPGQEALCRAKEMPSVGRSEKCGATEVLGGNQVPHQLYRNETHRWYMIPPAHNRFATEPELEIQSPGFLSCTPSSEILSPNFFKF